MLYTLIVHWIKTAKVRSLESEILTFAVINILAADRCGCFRIGAHFTVILQRLVLIVATLAVFAILFGPVSEVLPGRAVSCSRRIITRT